MNLKSFLQNFPPPQYIDVPLTGIAFTDNSVRMISLDKKNKHPIFSAEIPLEYGTIELGLIKRGDVLAQLLSEKLHSAGSPFVRFCIPDEISYVFNAKVPVVNGKDAADSVSFILEENVPLPLADTSYDFGVKKVEQGEQGFMADVAVMATSTSTVTMYLSTLRSAGFEPINCITESQAVANAVISMELKAPTAIVHVHKQSVGIYVVSNGLVIFSSVVSITDSESLKNKIESIKSELSRAIEYSSNTASGGGEGENLSCYVCGEYDGLEDLIADLKSVPRAVTQPANVWINAFSIDDYLPDISYEDSLKFAPAIGLLIDEGGVAIR